jgi:hypothetical protein
MYRPNEPHSGPKMAPGRLDRISTDPTKAFRAIKPVPINLRAQLSVEPRGNVRFVHTDVLIEMPGLEAEFQFQEGTGVGRRSGTATASLLLPRENFIPPRGAAQITGSSAAILGVEFRDGELEPIGKVVPIMPHTEGSVSIDASLEILAAISVNFSWVASAAQSGPEILLGGDLRFLRGVIGRLILRNESPARLSTHRYLNVTDVTFLRPGQLIHFPEQFVPLHGEAGELARIGYRFGPDSAPKRRRAGT